MTPPQCAHIFSPHGKGPRASTGDNPCYLLHGFRQGNCWSSKKIMELSSLDIQARLFLVSLWLGCRGKSPLASNSWVQDTGNQTYFSKIRVKHRNDLNICWQEWARWNAECSDPIDLHNKSNVLTPPHELRMWHALTPVPWVWSATVLHVVCQYLYKRKSTHPGQSPLHKISFNESVLNAGRNINLEVSFGKSGRKIKKKNKRFWPEVVFYKSL